MKVNVFKKVTKPNSSKVLTYSSGELTAENVVFEVVFECLICCPVENAYFVCCKKYYKSRY